MKTIALLALLLFSGVAYANGEQLQEAAPPSIVPEQIGKPPACILEAGRGCCSWHKGQCGDRVPGRGVRSDQEVIDSSEFWGANQLAIAGKLTLGFSPRSARVSRVM